MSEPALFGSTFFITSDASELVLGEQSFKVFDGVRKPVALFSRKLTQSQLNWAVKEREMYAIVALYISGLE